MKTGLFEEVDHHLTSLLHVAVLRGDGGQRDPVLQALDRFGALFLDRGADGGQIAAELRVGAGLAIVAINNSPRRLGRSMCDVLIHDSRHLIDSEM